MAIRRRCLGPSEMTRSSTTMPPTRAVGTRRRRRETSPGRTRRQAAERSRSNSSRISLDVTLHSQKGKQVCSQLLPFHHSSHMPIYRHYEKGNSSSIIVHHPTHSSRHMSSPPSPAHRSSFSSSPRPASSIPSPPQNYSPLSHNRRAKTLSRPVSTPPTAPFLPPSPSAPLSAAALATQ